MRNPIAAALLLTVSASFARAESAVDRRKELDSVRSQIEMKRQELDALHRKQEEALRDMGRLRSEKESSQRRLRQLEEGRRKAESQKRDLGEKLAALTMAEGKGRVILAGEFSQYARELSVDFPQYGRSSLWKESYRRAALREKAGYLSRLRVYQAQTAEDRAKTMARDRDLHD